MPAEMITFNNFVYLENSVQSKKECRAIGACNTFNNEHWQKPFWILLCDVTKADTGISSDAENPFQMYARNIQTFYFKLHFQLNHKSECNLSFISRMDN